ncbi:MAG: glycosyltransferase [Sandaracinaceae bacterium]
MSAVSPTTQPSVPASAEPPPIERRYLLLTFIPYYLDDAGDVWLDQLWHRDFVQHLRYLPKLTLAAPRLRAEDGPDDLVRVELPAGAELELWPLPHVQTTLSAAAQLPLTAARLWRAIGEHDILHSGVAGWPIPIGWVGNAVAMLRKRPFVLMVESAPWRPSTGDEGVKDHVRAAITEALARFFVRRADVVFFTQPSYARTLAREGQPGAHVTPATWIDEADILTRELAEARWAAKGDRVRLLFAGRLVAAKGVDLLLGAIRDLHDRGVRVDVDIIGDGPRRARCEAVAEQVPGLRVLDPVPYGAPFFELLEGYHGVLVPSLGDEQPRIVFDAYARAVPVIASDTDGLRPHVEEGETGWLFARGDRAALADVLERASQGASTLRRMGLRALAEAPGFTHRGMHLSRWRILHGRFGRR